jgi:hypothetical protein
MFYNVKIQEDANQQPKLRRTTTLLRRTGNFWSQGTGTWYILNLKRIRLPVFFIWAALFRKASWFTKWAISLSNYLMRLTIPNIWYY